MLRLGQREHLWLLGTTMRSLKIAVFLILISTTSFAGTGTRTTYNPFSSKLDYIGAEDIKTDCSGDTKEGQTCWDSDNNKFYIGDGSTVQEIGAGGGGAWGSITGTLSSQTDLQNALDAKLATVTVDSPLSGSGTSGSHLTVDLSSKQSADADLTTWAGLTPSAYFQTLVDDADAGTARTTLGGVVTRAQALALTTGS